MLQTIITVVFSVLAVSFWVLQVVQHEKYVKMADSNYQRTLALRAPRGVLFDRHGHVLVENRNSYTISIIRENTKDLARTVRALAAVLGLDVAEVEAIVDRHRREPSYRPIVIVQDASLEQVAEHSGRYTRARALTLFAMLEANSDHLVQHPLPAAGRDVEGADGVVYPFGAAGAFGNATLANGATAVDLEPNPARTGYWIVEDTGRVLAFGGARNDLGGAAGKTVNIGARNDAYGTGLAKAVQERFCAEAGLVGGEWVAIDGSKFQAVASKRSVVTASKLEEQLKALDRQVQGYLESLDAADEAEGQSGEADKQAIREALARLQERRAGNRDSDTRQHCAGRVEHPSKDFTGLLLRGAGNAGEQHQRNGRERGFQSHSASPPGRR